MRAGDVTFAIYTSRTGTLNGLPANSTSYLHNDHLSSIAVITDENGAVAERLAYDPWGKRRFINTTPGQTDKLDTLVGIRTDRGYTEHEHLDEIGVIHMNGRVYDPLVGRFMSADPFIQAPYNLKSFNRYAYVWNNPLKLFDPKGFNARDDSRSGAGYGSTRGFSDPVGMGGVASGSIGWSIGGNTGSARVPSYFAGAAPGPGVFSAGWGYGFSIVGYGNAAKATDSSRPSEGVAYGFSIAIHDSGQVSMSLDTTTHSDVVGAGVGTYSNASLTYSATPPTTGWNPPSVTTGTEAGFGLGPRYSAFINGYSVANGENNSSLTGSLSIPGGFGIGAYTAATRTESFGLTGSLNSSLVPGLVLMNVLSLYSEEAARAVFYGDDRTTTDQNTQTEAPDSGSSGWSDF